MSKILILAIILILGSSVFIPSISASTFQSYTHEQATETSLPNDQIFKEISHIATFSADFGAISWIGWKPNSENLAITYEQDNKIRILNTNTGKVERVLEVASSVGGIRSIAWSPNGDLIACSVNDPNDNIYIWDLSHDDKNLPLTITHSGQRSAISWSPDSKQLISVGAFGSEQNHWKVSIWNVSSGKEEYHFQDFNGSPVIKALWSPNDDNRIATITQIKNVFGLQIRDKYFQVLNNFPIQSENLVLLTSVYWTPNENKLVGASCDPVSGACFLWIWDIQTDKVLQPFH
jgi:WD40 repeat protein